MINLFKTFFNVIFPPTCHICKEVIDHSGICNKCWRGLVFITNPKCKICGFPFEFHDMESDINANLICPRCLKDAPDFDRAISVLKYNEASKEIVLPFKHADQTNLRFFISDLMSSSIVAESDILKECDFIVPVPLHFKRLLKRKYNQASLLAVEISGKLKIPYLNGLRRVKFSQSQGHLSTKKRKENIRDCFDINTKYRDKIVGANILLIDDVMTTGATVNECSRMLKHYGVSKVFVLTFCRVS